MAEAKRSRPVAEATIGELTVAAVALETSLSVEEADRMLSPLAAKGHLEVRAEPRSICPQRPCRNAPGRLELSAFDPSSLRFV